MLSLLIVSDSSDKALGCGWGLVKHCGVAHSGVEPEYENSGAPVTRASNDISDSMKREMNIILYQMATTREDATRRFNKDLQCLKNGFQKAEISIQVPLFKILQISKLREDVKCK